MIDYVKILVKDVNYSKLSKNSLLIFCHVNINAETGEVRTTNRNGQKITPFQNAYYRGLEFRIYENGTVTIAGSLHKYWNKGAHNYNDFNYNSFLSVLNDLKIKFDINPCQCVLKCLEVGINLLPPIPTNEVLDNCLLHKTKPFEYQKNSDEGKYKQVQHSQYIIKIYDKARHYKSKGFEIDTEIIRFEIKYTKMQKVNAMCVFTLADLTLDKLQNKFKIELLNEWGNVLFYDKTIQIDTLGEKIKNRLLKYSNQNYWTDILENNQNKNFNYHRKQLNEITENNSDKVQKNINDLINKKVDFLNLKTIQIDTLTIRSKWIVNENKICFITGLNISMQKDDSLMLSHTGLKYYYETDKKIFEQIKRKFLSDKWSQSEYKVQIKEIAHNIRNSSSNQKIKQSKIYKSYQINLLHALKVN